MCQGDEVVTSLSRQRFLSCGANETSTLMIGINHSLFDLLIHNLSWEKYALPAKGNKFQEVDMSKHAERFPSAFRSGS